MGGDRRDSRPSRASFAAVPPPAAQKPSTGSSGEMTLPSEHRGRARHRRIARAPRRRPRRRAASRGSRSPGPTMRFRRRLSAAGAAPRRRRAPPRPGPPRGSTRFAARGGPRNERRCCLHTVLLRGRPEGVAWQELRNGRVEPATATALFRAAAGLGHVAGQAPGSGLPSASPCTTAWRRCRCAAPWRPARHRAAARRASGPIAPLVPASLSVWQRPQGGAALPANSALPWASCLASSADRAASGTARPAARATAASAPRRRPQDDADPLAARLRQPRP